MQAKPIRFSRHARNRMRLRGIARRLAHECIEAPDTQQAMPSGRINAWKRVGGSYLRVVYVEEEGIRVIVTVIFLAKAPAEEEA